MKRILVISPHADDGELWAGASMARWAAAGDEVHHACASCLGSKVLESPREAEWKAAQKVLGIKHTYMQDFPDMDFPHHRKEIREWLESLAHKFDLVIVPPSGDRHQDHAVVHEEAKRAFRFCSLLGFDIPYNEPTNRPTFYVPVTEDELVLKLAACSYYESQAHHLYMDVGAIRSIAMLRGGMIRREYAEAFEVIRWIS